MENNLCVLINHNWNYNSDFEVVECKGKGHPDTLSDSLGERLSVAYSKYCLKNFGVILHHNFDKVGMMGGISKVGFHVGDITSPIRVLLNGRASASFGNHKIDLRELFENEVQKFFKESFPHISDIKQIYRVMWEVSSGSSPGGISQEESFRKQWFKPRGKQDISELIHLNCNDTSMGCAYYGNTPIEKFVLNVESRLNSTEFKKDKPWLGSDIKIMCCRFNKSVSLTLCVPQIGIYVGNIVEYKNNLALIRNEIHRIAQEIIPDMDISININMRDRYDSTEKDLYLTYTGSSIEMGDEGFVGRGNRFGGLITPNRLYSMEGIAGKNPVYHTGKMYSVFAYEIAKKIYEEFDSFSEVLLVGMTGHSLMKPHRIVVNTSNHSLSNDDVTKMIDSIDPEKITLNILNGRYKMF